MERATFLPEGGTIKKLKNHIYMNNSNYYQGAYPQSGQRAERKKETPVNKVEFTGIVKPRGNFPDIQVKQMPSGGAVVKFSLECKEVTGAADANGNPKVITTYVPVSVFSNKIISVAMLQSIAEGMKVHVVGRWRNQHYKDRSGVDKNFTECEAFVLDIQQQPQAAPAPYAPQYGYGQGQPAYPAYGQQYPQPAPQPQYPPQAPPQYAPQQPLYPAYQPQGAPVPQVPPQMPPQYNPPAQQGQQAPPPYWQPPQGQQPQAAPAPVPNSEEDLEKIFP